MKEYEAKIKDLEEIEKIYLFSFKDDININTIEKPNPNRITFCESDLEQSSSRIMIQW